MPAVPIALWRRITLKQALTIHVAANLSASVWDAIVADETVTWTTVGLVANLLIEAFFIWRLWARGRIAWWIGLVLQAVGLALVPILFTNPAVLEYPTETHLLEVLPLLLLDALALAAWIAPSVRSHVRGTRAGGRQLEDAR